MTQNLTLQTVNADLINANFTSIENAVNAKAELNGDSTEKFNVANAIESTEAINKGQLDSTVSTLNSNITSIDDRIETELAEKLDSSDTTVTKQGNSFNGSNQLVQLDSNGKLPAIDGTLLTGIGNYTSSTTDMPTLSNNAEGPNTQINFTAGFCYDLETHQKITNTAMTKKLDEIFVAGTGNGGLDIGSKAALTWYHCFAISKSDGASDFLFSTSLTSPTMPSGFVNKRRIGSIRTNSSGNILGFAQIENTFKWKTVITEVNATWNTIPTDLIITTPLGIITQAILGTITAGSTTGSTHFLVEKLTGQNIYLRWDAGGNVGHTPYSQYCNIFTNTSSQIQYYATHNLSPYYSAIYNYGYIDSRKDC